MVTGIWMLTNRRVQIAVIGLFIICSDMGQACAEDSTLIRVQTRRAKSYVGELIASDNDGVKLYDIKLGTEVSVPKRDISRLTQPLSDDDAARAIGLPSLFAWQISKLPASKSKVGKIAKVTPTSVYFTLSKDQVEVGQKLSVFRRKGEIIDPDTGKVLAVERPLVAELEVTEVSGAFSKGKLVGALEIELETGDEVELPGAGERKVAVCPIYSATGELTNVGVELSEDLTTRLVKKKIKVVERSAISDVLTELVVQNSILFDAKSAQKLGKLTGASHVVVGKIVRTGKLGKTYIRLVDVESGEILQAASATLSLVNARVIGGSSENRPTTPSGNSPSSSRSRSSRSLAVELTDDAPKWMLKRVARGTKLWWDRDYAISTIPKEISGGTLVIRSKGDETEWIKPGTLTMRQAGTIYVVMRSHYLGKEAVGEIVNSQFERDGWTIVEGLFRTTFPGGENWKWVVFKKSIEEGTVLVSLESVRWPNKVPALFIFK